MPEITQLHQQGAIATKLGDDALKLRSASVHESLGHPFSIVVEISQASPDKPISPKDLIGSNASLRLNLPSEDKPRYWNGEIIDLDYAGQADNLPIYRLTLAPRLHFLGRTADFRAIQGEKVPDIIKSIFKDHALDTVKFDLHDTYEPWDYCVQYRETDMNFVSRLMEQEGIYYYFTHENGKHTLVVTDEAASHKSTAKYESLKWRPMVGGGNDNSEYVFDVSLNYSVQPDHYTSADYDFRTPRKLLRATATSDQNHGAGSFDVFDFPGEWDKEGDGERFTKIRLEELQAQRELFSATTNARGLAAGAVVKIEEHPNPVLNRLLLITSVNLSFSNGDAHSGGGSDEGSFHCTFTGIDAKTQYRTPRSAPKPIVQGPQTAVVVGPKGAELHTDEYGRVKIQFHWDRYSKMDEKSSFWCRVGQAWAGKNWGAMFIPRIGMEVIVSFLEGDPDQPLITGCLYNGDNMPPYALPEHATRSTIKSNSSKGGNGFNEIRFEDKKGEEQVFTHAEKDLDARVKNVSREWVGNDRHLVVEHDQFEHVKRDRSELIDRDHIEQIKRNHNETIDGKDSKKVGGKMTVKVIGDVAEVFQANHSETVSGDYYLKATNIVIEATTSITVKVGSNYLAIDNGGVKIGSVGTFDTESTGPSTLKSTAPMTVESQAMTKVSAPMTQVGGDAMLKLQGGIVMIN